MKKFNVWLSKVSYVLLISRKEVLLLMIALAYLSYKYVMRLPIEEVNTNTVELSIAFLAIYATVMEIAIFDEFQNYHIVFVSMTACFIVAYFNPAILPPLLLMLFFFYLSMDMLKKTANIGGNEFLDANAREFPSVLPPQGTKPDGTAQNPFMVRVGIMDCRSNEVKELIEASKKMKLTQISKRLLQILMLVDSLDKEHPLRIKEMESLRGLISDIKDIRANSDNVIDDLEVLQRAESIMKYFY